jgi:hypothetical protein
VLPASPPPRGVSLLSTSEISTDMCHGRRPFRAGRTHSDWPKLGAGASGSLAHFTESAFFIPNPAQAVVGAITNDYRRHGAAVKCLCFRRYSCVKASALQLTKLSAEGRNTVLVYRFVASALTALTAAASEYAGPRKPEDDSASLRMSFARYWGWYLS